MPGAAEAVCVILRGLSGQAEVAKALILQCRLRREGNVVTASGAFSELIVQMLLKLPSCSCGSKTMLPLLEGTEHRRCQWERAMTKQVVAPSPLCGIAHCMVTADYGI